MIVIVLSSMIFILISWITSFPLRVPIPSSDKCGPNLSGRIRYCVVLIIGAAVLYCIYNRESNVK